MITIILLKIVIITGVFLLKQLKKTFLLLISNPISRQFVHILQGG